MCLPKLTASEPADTNPLPEVPVLPAQRNLYVAVAPIGVMVYDGITARRLFHLECVTLDEDDNRINIPSATPFDDALREINTELANFDVCSLHYLKNFYTDALLNAFERYSGLLKVYLHQPTVVDSLCPIMDDLTTLGCDISLRFLSPDLYSDTITSWGDYERLDGKEGLRVNIADDITTCYFERIDGRETLFVPQYIADDRNIYEGLYWLVYFYSFIF